MRRLVATSLLFGYIILVPFCFFGGAAMANMDMIGQPTAQMNDCEMPLSGCTHASNEGVMGFIEHHVGMYLSITQTPLGAFAVMATLLFVFALYLLSHQLSGTLLARYSARIVTRPPEKPQNSSRLRLLAWLSLFEASPNFA